jgi:hypothetical protein
MRNIILISVFLLSLSLNLAGQSEIAKATRFSREIIIDGKDNDWIQPFNFYDDASGLMFSIGNNNQHLFLCFKDNNEMKMKKMISAGWTLELTAKEAKKKIKSQLKFPGYNVMGIRTGQGMYEKRSAVNNLLEIYLLQLKTVSAKGFQSGIRELALNNSKGINIGIGTDTLQHIVFEIAIPLTEIFISDFNNPTELFTLKVTVNALERPSSGGDGGGGMSGMGGGNPEGGMSGRGGGGSRGGGSRGGSRSSGMNRSGEAGGERSSLFEQVSFKQKFMLTGN